MTRDPRTVMQLLGNWSDHVTSWVRAEEFGVPARFFRRGASGQWRDGLAGDIVARIAADHGPVMKRHGYLA